MLSVEITECGNDKFYIVGDNCFNNGQKVNIFTAIANRNQLNKILDYFGKEYPNMQSFFK